MSMGAPDLRIGTSGWNYPSGRGTWNGVFYPPSRGRAKGFDELSFYAEHFNTVEVNSTFYGQPRADGHAAAGRSGRRPGFEFSIKLYQKFTHPKMFKEAFTKGVSRPSGPDGDASARCAGAAQPVGPRRLPRGHRSAGVERQARRAARAVSAELQGQPGVARLPGVAARGVRGPPRGRRACGTAAGATRSATRCRCSTRSDRRGCRSTSRSSGSRSNRTSCRTWKGSTTCGSTAGTRRSGGATRRVRRPLQLPLHRARAQRVRRNRSTPRGSSSRSSISTRTTTSRRSRWPTRR